MVDKYSKYTAGLVLILFVNNTRGFYNVPYLFKLKYLSVHPDYLTENENPV